MQLIEYIEAVETYGPRLVELGYQLGDWNDTLPAIYVEGWGQMIYVRMDDTERLDELVDPDRHAALLESLNGPSAFERESAALEA